MRTLRSNLRFLVLRTVVRFTPVLNFHTNFIIFHEILNIAEVS